MSNGTYKRSVSRRESFRIDFTADDVKEILLEFMETQGEDVFPENVAFRVHPDGAATFCWDVDYDVDGPSIQAIANDIERVSKLRERPQHIEQNQDGSLPDHHDLEHPPNTAVAQVVHVEAASLESDVEPERRTGERRTPHCGDPHCDDCKGPVVRGPDRRVAVPEQDGDVALMPVDSRKREILVDASLGPVQVVADRSPAPQTPYEKNLARHAGKTPVVSGDEEQCDNSFRVGITKTFRCHLDAGHTGACGAAPGCEPEDPPKGRRRSW